MSVSIPDFIEEDGVVQYHISVSLPLRSISVYKRYSDFVSLARSLCDDLGIASSEFPYGLPPKSSIFANKHKVAHERQPKLQLFLEKLIRDRDLQNSPKLHSFLQLPKNFKFTPELFKDTKESITAEEKFLIDDDPKDIDKNKWLQLFRVVRSSVEKLKKDESISTRVANREKVSKYVGPNLKTLSEALQILSTTQKIDPAETRHRTTSLAAVQQSVEQLLDDGSRKKIAEPMVAQSKRSFPKPDQPLETKDTVALSKQQLLQQQQQIHANQDKEIEELRKIIARQRQIGEAINQEVEEQNEMLDEFANEVENSSDKLQNARGRARKIG